MSTRQQSARRHARYFPLYHYFAFPVTTLYALYVTLTAIFVHTVAAVVHAVWAWAIAAGLLAARVMALTVQDRVIRLEETTRMQRILPPEMHGDIGTLRRRHFIALRFASDDELTDLVRRTLAGEFDTTREIKAAIRDWRPDWLRA